MFIESDTPPITTLSPLFKGDPAVRESEGSLLRARHDQRGAADHHVPQPAILQVCLMHYLCSILKHHYLSYSIMLKGFGSLFDGLNLK